MTKKETWVNRNSLADWLVENKWDDVLPIWNKFKEDRLLTWNKIKETLDYALISRDEYPEIYREINRCIGILSDWFFKGYLAKDMRVGFSFMLENYSQLTRVSGSKKKEIDACFVELETWREEWVRNKAPIDFDIIRSALLLYSIRTFKNDDSFEKICPTRVADNKQYLWLIGKTELILRGVKIGFERLIALEKWFREQESNEVKGEIITSTKEGFMRCDFHTEKTCIEIKFSRVCNERKDALGLIDSIIRTMILNEHGSNFTKAVYFNGNNGNLVTLYMNKLDPNVLNILNGFKDEFIRWKVNNRKLG